MPIYFHSSAHPSCANLALVEISFATPITSDQFSNWLGQMTQLLQAQQPFVAIYHSDPDLQLPDDYRHQEAQWYKAYKSQFFTYCKALVRIANDVNEQQRLNTPAMHKAWQVPYTVVLDKSDAITWLEQQWLNNGTQSVVRL